MALAETSNDEVARELKEMKKALQQQNELIQKQQAKIEELERKVETVRADPEQSRKIETRTAVNQDVRPSTSSGRTAAAPGQIGAVLPEIGVVGDIVAISSQKRSDTEDNDRIAARELELVLGNYVDPYSRFDARRGPRRE